MSRQDLAQPDHAPGAGDEVAAVAELEVGVGRERDLLPWYAPEESARSSQQKDAFKSN